MGEVAKVLAIGLVALFGFDILMWTMNAGTNEEGAMVCGGSDRVEIMDTLEEYPEGLTQGEIYDVTGLGTIRIQSELACLKDEHLVRERDRGLLSNSVYIVNQREKS